MVHKVDGSPTTEDVTLMETKVPPGSMGVKLRSTRNGLLIEKIEEDSVAADLKVGDVIVALDGVDVSLLFRSEIFVNFIFGNGMFMDRVYCVYVYLYYIYFVAIMPFLDHIILLVSSKLHLDNHIHSIRKQFVGIVLPTQHRNKTIPCKREAAISIHRL